MRILVFNAGSSSLKFGLFDIGPSGQERHVFKGSFDSFRAGGCAYSFSSPGGSERGTAPYGDLAAAIAAVPGVLADLDLGAPDAVGHRLVHGGPDHATAARLDDALVERLRGLTPLAPLHNPANLRAVDIARTTWPDLPQAAVFDTAFHLTAPPAATTYAVPKEWRDAGLRRYGFHGTSHKYVAQRAAQALGRPLAELRLVSLHLGNGASACAVSGGQSVETSMGMTPLEGLVMGTRSGDVDPGAFGYLERRLGLDIATIEDALYRDSGLKALAGTRDMREVAARAGQGDEEARLAVEIYAHRARKYLGAYAAAMGGLDAVVFTGGIGENAPDMRARICADLEFMGLRLDPARNAAPDLSDRAAPQLQADASTVAVLVTETAEQLMIARETADLLAGAG
ncbi:hypothetical protein C2I36_01590 [Rhodobacteraceae bacterium WD3A24]|nr:hypothetical protein C2I36_01590 [Rhodobacteraceae bacterium WD3A24]